MTDALISGLAVSFAVSLLLVLTKHWHGRFTFDHTHGVQKFHTKPTPRIGGVGVAAGLVTVSAMALEDVNALLNPLLLAAIPAFAAGLWEDLTKRIGVVTRLTATMLSGTLAWWLTDIALDHVHIPLVDDLLALTPAAVLFTAFAVAGVANAVNIIDGFNGLASGTVLVLLASLASMAHAQGDLPLTLAFVSLGAAVLGFWLVNFPLGKIFLGDGGAYLVGFALAWLCVLLMMRHPNVSPWVVLLACAYPVTEVLYSMWRRHRLRQPAGAPDNLHLHSLVKTQIILRHIPHWPPRLRNAAVSPLMWVGASLPAGVAVLLVNAPVWVPAAALGGCVLIYHAVYRWLARMAPAVTLHGENQVAPAPAGHHPGRKDLI